MVTDQLIVYIKNQLKSGFTDAQIRKALLKQGWEEADIDLAYAKVGNANNNLSSVFDLLNISLKILKAKWKTILSLYIFIFVRFLMFMLILAIIVGISAFIIFRLKPAQSASFILAAISVSIGSILVIYYSNRLIISLLLFLETPVGHLPAKEIFAKSKGKIFQFLEIFLLASIYYLFGFAFFIIPGLIFMVKFAFAPYFYLFEDIKGSNALFASRELVKDRFWAVAGRLLAITFFSWGINYIFRLIHSSFISLLDLPVYQMHSIVLPDPKIYIPAILFSLIFGLFVFFLEVVFITPLVQIYYIVLFKDLKQNYAGSFPVYSQKSKMNLLVPAIVLILILSMLGFYAYNAARPRFSISPSPTPSSWYPDEKITPIVQNENVQVYEDPSCGFSIVYTRDYDEQITDTMQTVYLHNNDNPHDDVEIHCAETLIPSDDNRVPASTEDIIIDGVKGVINHYYLDHEPQDLDEIIITHPGNNKIIQILGFGQIFTQRISTISLGKG